MIDRGQDRETGGVASWVLRGFGLTAIAAGVMIYFLGPDVTARVFAVLLENLVEPPVYRGGLDGADSDSEMRFFAVFWIAYGAAVMHQARDVDGNRTMLLGLAALFFAGGLGRVLSLWSVQEPSSLFIILMWIELLLPWPIAAMILRTEPKQ
ncbi:DUF4345 domain-containing protein [Alisedimentitalea sp. MJ-SS2]|uniref:DUF4345 domain-containing protein n=1 Tax=Aliisedimentitalea sp. MJ-SS2 TaxID=3049795 RepID=UPI002910B098|nr:DUF4345 domain-containing protein [Alisedimentitalea sp. MJ-SS2]MDU8929387.1 DUF4345 domain-containing protein [Alisedimentitalea sp. MJ-SS2]